jgi:hypothetical protein
VQGVFGVVGLVSQYPMLIEPPVLSSVNVFRSEFAAKQFPLVTDSAVAVILSLTLGLPPCAHAKPGKSAKAAAEINFMLPPVPRTSQLAQHVCADLLPIYRRINPRKTHAPPRRNMLP